MACRRVVRTETGSYVAETKILCQADKAACDELAADYRMLDEQMRASLEKRQRP